MNSLTITVPIPDAALHPNARAHWARKMRAAKVARKQAHDAAVFALTDAMNRPAPRWTSATITPRFFVKDKRGLRQDADNAIAACKSYADGIADAGIVDNDRAFQWGTPEFNVDRESRRLELVVTPLPQQRSEA